MLDLTTALLLARDLGTLGVPLPAGAQTVLDVRDAALTAANASPADDLAAGLTDGTLTPDTVGERLLAAALAATAQEKHTPCSVTCRCRWSAASPRPSAATLTGC